MLRPARLALALLGLGVACALLVGRLPPDLERTVVTRRHHGSDPLLSAALLRFDVDSLLREPTRYFSPPFLYPDPNPLRGTEPLVAEALLAVPFRIALGDRPAAVYTCVKLTTLALVVLLTGLLLYELGVRPSLCLQGAGLAALVGTMPVFADRLQAVSIQWLPFAGLFASRFLRRGRLLDAALFAVGSFLLVQASLYTAVMLLAPLPFLLPALCRLGGAWRRALGLVCAAGVAGALCIAVLWPYLARRADVAAYASPAYAASKTWQPAGLGAFAVSPPEYSGWPLGPPADWQGLFPGTAFVLLLAGCCAFAIFDRSPAERTDAAPPAFRSTKLLLAALLAGLVAVVAARGFGVGPPAPAGDVLLWAALVVWPVRLALWPSSAARAAAGERPPRAPLALLASAGALAAFVLWLVSLGSPVRWQDGGPPLVTGVFAPLSAALPAIRELRELNRCLLPAGWLAVMAATLSLERRLRRRPTRAALGAAFAAAVLVVGIGERAAADTRKGTAPAVPAAYDLLRSSAATGGLLELPVDPWGRIESVYRMLWQPAHGRPIVAGRTGIEPAWYAPAREVFDEFPSEESLRLARTWHVDTVIDSRADARGPWPASVVPRAEQAAPVGRQTDATWRVFDLGSGDEIPPEPAPGPGRWASPPPSRDLAAAARDDTTATAAEVGAEGVELPAPEGRAVAAIEIDYGRGLFNRVPRTLQVLGLESGAWRELAGPEALQFLRARVAVQLLRDQSARLVIPLQPSHASRLRLVSPDGPWDLPELRLRVVADQ